MMCAIFSKEADNRSALSVLLGWFENEPCAMRLCHFAFLQRTQHSYKYGWTRAARTMPAAAAACLAFGFSKGIFVLRNCCCCWWKWGKGLDSPFSFGGETEKPFMDTVFKTREKNISRLWPITLASENRDDASKKQLAGIIFALREVCPADVCIAQCQNYRMPGRIFYWK